MQSPGFYKDPGLCFMCLTRLAVFCRSIDMKYDEIIDW